MSYIATQRNMLGVRAVGVLLAVVTALGATLAVASVAEAQEAGLGKPYRIAFNQTAQKAIVGGGVAAAGTVACVAGGAAVCTTVVPTAIGIASPIIADAVVCPNNGRRVVELVNNLAPPRPGEVVSTIITSYTGFTTCIP